MSLFKCLWFYTQLWKKCSFLIWKYVCDSSLFWIMCTRHASIHRHFNMSPLNSTSFHQLSLLPSISLHTVSMISLCRRPHSHWGIFSESLNWYHLAMYSFIPGPMASFDWPIQPVPFCRFLFFVPFARSSTSPLCWNERNPQPYCCVMMIISCKSSASQHIVYYES